LQSWLIVKKMALNIGYGKDITKKSIEKKFLKLLNNYELRKRLNRNSKTIIDGKGAKKISKIIQQHYTKKLDF